MSIDTDARAEQPDAEADADPWDGWDEWRATHLYHRWYDATQRGEPNDFVIAVSASSHTPVSGTGKTTLQTVLGQEFDCSPDGFDATQKATVDVRELAYDRVPDVPNRSAVVADELQGLASTHGLDARRGMRQSSIDAINSILGHRDKQLTIIVGAQILAMLDKRFLQLVDAWLMIVHEPDSPYGPLAKHHDVYFDDYSFGNPQPRTPVLEELTWPRLPHDDPDYVELTRLKHEYRQQRKDESTTDPLATRNEQIRDAYERGTDQYTLAEVFGLNQSTISRIIGDD